MSGERRRTDRWRGVNAVALVVSGAGILANQPGLVLAGVIGIAFAAVSRAGMPPTIDLSVDRQLSDRSPDSGEVVRVTVRVENTGNSLLSDLRFIDGVPPALTVESGSPRLGTALKPGKAAEFEYAVRASRGVHQFTPSLAIARDASGTAERRLEVSDQSTITCVPSLSTMQPVSLPLSAQTTGSAGRVVTDDGGSGVVFHTVREYRHGDPLNRIDWNRAARTGEFSTIEFQRERSATVVILIDARESAYTALASDDSPVIERSITAAGALFDGCLASDDRVGVAALSPTDCWLAPGSGTTHRARAETLLATHEALSPTAPDEPFFKMMKLRRLRRLLPTDAQVVFCTPLSDAYATIVARRLNAHGHHVTVLSPDPTAQRTEQVDETEAMGQTDRTAGQTLERIDRSLRCSSLRDDGIRVVDWGTEPLQTAIDGAARRWSA
ncbi:DUF58 domain-containing protein [Halocatena marina]|uniref:DUF58 domain-containing protein n=1 Tax=Halocatena marina TaxID=2934937 RepID=A0ABD5YSE9_9EURY|nr:DUF58 domain-containing protein [Halocatena marina]